MVDVMGRTPEEVKQTLRAQMAAAEKRATDARDLVRTQTTMRFGEDGGSLKEYLNSVDSTLGSLGAGQR